MKFVSAYNLIEEFEPRPDRHDPVFLISTSSQEGRATDLYRFVPI